MTTSAIATEPRKAPDYLRNAARDISEAEPYRRRFADLQEDGRTWRNLWREIDENQFPKRGRWLYGDGERVHDAHAYGNRLLNNTPLSCRRTVASGLQTGLIPSSREWWSVQPENEDIRDNAKVTYYLSKLKKKGNQILAATNFYTESNGLFEDASAFGTAAMLMEDDDETVLSFVRLPVGSFWPESDAANRVIGLARRYTMTSESMLEQFGREALPSRIIDLLEQGRFYDREVIIQHIRPVDPEDKDAPDWAKFESVYFLEQSRQDGEDKLLTRSYYRAKPFIVFRWTVDDGTAYGTRCPGIDSNGDCKQLQALERKELLAIDMGIDPPVAAPKSLLGSLNRRPGTVTWIGNDMNTEMIQPISKVQYNIAPVTAKIERTERRIERAYYNDLFLSMIGNTKQMTAEEARQRAEEKTMVLGPVIERFQYDLLPSILDRLIDAIMFHGLAPAPPEELQGVKYVYSGPLALIQRMSELGDIERWLNLAAGVAATKQSQNALDRIDDDEIIEIAAQIMGIDPVLIVSYADAKKERQARGEQAAAAQQRQAMLDAAKGAEQLSKADLDGNNALAAMAGEGGQ